jgi:hypothetical protein
MIDKPFRTTFARTIKYLRKNSRERGHDANVDMFIKAMEINKIEPTGDNLKLIDGAKPK